MLRIPYETAVSEMSLILEKKGFTPERARLCAEIFADNSLAGVPTHGINRFPRTVFYLNNGMLDAGSEPECLLSFGCLERWDGHRGFGPLNCKLAMNRAIELAKAHGIGIVALGNNNHWMRGAMYGFQAANAGCIGICFTNSQPNMPAWGGRDRRIGNNPLVIAVPRSDGRHVVADCAMSLFSYGMMENCRIKGEKLPFIGGYDREGKLTDDPGEIEKTWRVLPIGYWKGSSLSILMDIAATILTHGNSVKKIGEIGDEVGLSQILIAIDPTMGGQCAASENDAMIEEIVEYIKASEPMDADTKIRYPGERETNNMEENRTLGIPVVEEKWEEILNMKNAKPGEEVKSLVGTSAAK